MTQYKMLRFVLIGFHKYVCLDSSLLKHLSKVLISQHCGFLGSQRPLRQCRRRRMGAISKRNRGRNEHCTIHIS